MKEFEELVEKILRDVYALPEERMRLNRLVKRLAPLAPDEIAKFFDMVYRKGADEKRARTVWGLLVDPDVLKGALGHDTHSRVYHASIELGLDKVSRLFTDLPPQKKGIRGYDKEEEAKMEFLTLGERRTLSKKNVKDTIDRLLSDPDAVVIKNILNNPRTTEREVLKIASKRPNSPDILKLLALHRVWSKRYPIKKAIVLNPYSSPRVSIALLEMMMFQDLKMVVGDKTIHPQVRLAAKDILENKGEGTSGDEGG
jgi:hypothetical protein